VATKEFTLTADFDKSDNPNLIALNDDVQLQINQCAQLDGTDDHIQNDNMLPVLANLTVGTIACWVYVARDDGQLNDIFSLSRDADAQNTHLSLTFYFGGAAPVDSIRMYCRDSAGALWEWNSAANVLDAFVGTWAHIAVVHDGTSAKFYLNGVDITAAGNWATATDKTKWFKYVITDATHTVDSFNYGLRENNGINNWPFEGYFDKCQISSTAKSPADIAATVAEDRIGGIDDPTDILQNLHCRGDATDASANGNDATLALGASVVNDPNKGYATTSPETYIRNAGNEYAIDAGAGNYVNIASIVATETKPAGTSQKYKYAFYDNPTRAEISWSSTWKDIGDISTDAAGDSTQKRYFHFKTQSNEDDGGDTSDLDDLEMTYTMPALMARKRRVHTGTHLGFGRAGIKTASALGA